MMTMIGRHRVGRVGTCLALACLFAGCQPAGRTKPGLLLFPSPPEKPRIQYLTWASGADEVEVGHGAFEKFILGEEPAAKRLIQKPYGVAARDGIVYVCDTKGLSLVRLDYRNRNYSIMGVNGPGRLRKPLNIAIDTRGYKFVVDSDRRQIVVFGPDDEYVTAFDVPQPCHPVDVAYYGDELYVLDNDDTCQIVVLDRVSGRVLRTLGGPGGEAGQFKIPNSLAVSPDGYLYVTDTHNWRIQKLTREGQSVWVKGGPGYRLGQFGRPRGVRVGPDGIVYVVDGATEIVQMFDADGQTLMHFGGPGNVPGALGLPSTLAIDAMSIPYFKEYIHKDFKVEYLLFVTSQVGAHLVTAYAFGAFPEGYKLEESQIERIESEPLEKGIGPVSGEDATLEPGPAQEPAAAPEPGAGDKPDESSEKRPPDAGR